MTPMYLVLGDNGVQARTFTSWIDTMETDRHLRTGRRYVRGGRSSGRCNFRPPPNSRFINTPDCYRGPGCPCHVRFKSTILGCWFRLMLESHWPFYTRVA